MMQPNGAQLAQCERLLRDLVVGQHGIEACLIASDAGFEVACVSRVFGFSPSRLSAFIGSAKALASAALTEARCGDFIDVVVGGSQGRLVLHPLDGERMLCLIASSEASISALRQCSRNAAAEIGALLGQNEAWINRRR